MYDAAASARRRRHGPLLRARALLGQRRVDVQEPVPAPVRCVRQPPQPPALLTRGTAALKEVLDTELNEGASRWTLVGSGASAVVFRGKINKRDAAIKIFKTSSPLRYFLNELDMIATIRDNSDIVQFVGYCCGRVRAIIMEYCELGSLFDVLHKEREIVTRRSRGGNEQSERWRDLVLHRQQIALGIARAMANLHSLSICHLDLTSRNVLVTSRYEPKVCDFGLSRCEAEGRCPPGGVSATANSTHHAPSYWKAPEIYRRRTKEDTSPLWSAKVDVFSFAMILWELFHLGHFPWEGELNPVSRLMRGERPTIAADVPPLWRELMVHCWDQSPEQRLSSQEIVDFITTRHMINVSEDLRSNAP
eukprot:TRINITY_DN152_c0_g2_i4.p1 TRINITY_DN152_c0_g2~~TRINITY_DN152_c0_g2_i4.p1  ORF type:complete len:363 (-),score=73.48 TRINITY_DN152_c0_g2_i4:589-1677(-)